jgi:predicted TIM-barrel fold metal-dependent hydrolase
MITTENNKFKGTRGGLDNAVRQAKVRDLDSLFIIDSDCHQMEPFAHFVKYISKPEYREALLAPDPEVKMQNALGYGTRVMRPEVSYPRPMEPEELIRTFSERMLDIGIRRSIVLPSAMLDLALDPRNPSYEIEVSNAYIKYMLEHAVGKHEEILTMIYAPTTAPQKAAEMIDDLGSEKGVVGVFIPGVTPIPPGDESFDPIYEAAQRKNLPVCVHGHHYRRGGLLERFNISLYTHSLGFPFSIIGQITSIVLSGVPERFPNLDFVFMEGGVTWIAWLMQRLDDEYIKRRFEAPLLKKLPSEYMKDFYYTSQPLERAHPKDLEFFFNAFDAENHLLYASDYPHWDFDVPSVIYDLPFLSAEGKAKVLGKNASKVFGIHQ